MRQGKENSEAKKALEVGRHHGIFGELTAGSFSWQDAELIAGGREEIEGGRKGQLLKGLVVCDRGVSAYPVATGRHWKGSGQKGHDQTF